MSTKNVTIRMEEDLKDASDKLFKELGFNMTTAITAFVKQAVREQRIPFEISLNAYNNETKEAFIESERLLQDPNIKRFSTMQELIEDLDDEV